LLLKRKLLLKSSKKEEKLLHSKLKEKPMLLTRPEETSKRELLPLLELIELPNKRLTMRKEKLLLNNSKLKTKQRMPKLLLPLELQREKQESWRMPSMLLISRSNNLKMPIGNSEDLRKLSKIEQLLLKMLLQRLHISFQEQERLLLRKKQKLSNKRGNLKLPSRLPKKVLPEPREKWKKE